MKKWSTLLALLLLLQTLSTALYLARAGGFGFPLDDAWIHQTYARNLGEHGLMAFSPGQPSTGSTSFGWTVLLAIGYVIEIPFFMWTYVLGGIFAVATAFAAASLSKSYFGNFRNAVVVATLCILEWHLAWGAVSGMEIGLFTFLCLLFFLCLHHKSSPLLLGLIAGFSMLVRPEGMILALVYMLHLVNPARHDLRRLVIQAALFFLVLGLTISPWIAFNWTYSGRPFPNTITAKFMQYGFPWSLGKSIRYVWDVLLYFVNGPLLLLLPGAGFGIYQLTKTRQTTLLYPVVWSLALVGLYAVALPAIYDHGRYLMPLIPLVLVCGVEGLRQLLSKFVQSFALRSVIWIALFSMVGLLWINGASDFAYRIQLFNKVHMRAAQWVNDNLPKSAVIATHDIGILGYYTQRPVVDLAGLVTPEIVPIMRKPEQLAEYLRTKQVSHVLVYSGYYRDLLDHLQAQVVYSPAAEELRAMGVEPFEIHEVGIP